MNEASTVDTSLRVPDREPRELTGFLRSLAGAAFVVRLAAASTYGARQCFMEETAATQIIGGALAEGSTQLREVNPEIQPRLAAILDAARHDIIEDGMPNAVSEYLPGLLAKDYTAVIPALLSVIEAGSTTPIIAAELLKELGRLRNAASHASRLWVLERALSLSSPFIRDGAGLGLARLADPDALPYLRRAVEGELNAQTRADLQLVIDELSETMRDGTPLADRH
jgi:hypothetical protein